MRKELKSYADEAFGIVETAANDIGSRLPGSEGEKKFADVGLIPGTELAIQSRAPFGGLIRVKVMQTSITIHSLDAKNILLEKDCAL